MKDLFAKDNQTEIIERYTIYSTVKAVSEDKNYFMLQNIAATFHCFNNFKPGDKVKITIEKEIDLG